MATAPQQATPRTGTPMAQRVRPGRQVPAAGFPARPVAVPGPDAATGGPRPLTIGFADDPVERAADAMVSRLGLDPAAAAPPPRAGITGDPGAARSGPVAPPAVARLLAAPGQSLPAPARGYFERAFARDLSKTEIYRGPAATACADAIGAEAFTLGSKVVLGGGAGAIGGAGPYDGTLAHELAHVAMADPRGGASATIIRRQPKKKAVKPPTTAERLDALEARQTASDAQRSATDVRLAALGLDLLWRAKFGERLAGYKAAAFTIGGALDTATQRFQAVQQAQAQTDAMRAQLIGMAAAVVFAGGFEWFVAGALGKLGVDAKRIEKIVEMAENPANAFVSGLVNVQGVRTATASAIRGQVPAVQPEGGGDGAGGAIDLLTSTMAQLEKTTQTIEQAFVTRRTILDQLPAADWAKFDVKAQATVYQGLLDQLDAASAGIDRLKPRAVLNKVLERHLWARWMLEETRALVIAVSGMLSMYQISPSLSSSSLMSDIGADIEDGLNAAGVAALAGVTLSGHWYKDNDPDNWKALLLNWANNYNERLKA